MRDQNQAIVRQEGNTNLPSTEYYETAPQIEDEIHLKDYLEVLIRRKLVVLITLILVFSGVAFYTFTLTPLFLSKGTIKASPQGLRVTNFDDISGGMMRSQEFIETQVKMITSERVIRKVIEGENLAQHPFFNPDAAQSGQAARGAQPSGLRAFVVSLKNMIRPTSSPSQASMNEINPALLNIVKTEELINRAKSPLQVNSVRNTQLIEVSYESSDSRFAAFMVNAVMKYFMVSLVENKLASQKSADLFLDKQIDELRIKLEQSEKTLNEFARMTGIISLDTRLNLVMSQLEATNAAYSDAVTNRIQIESLYRQTLKEGGGNLPQILADSMLQELKGEYAKLTSEYQDQSVIFKDGYPQMQKLKAKMEDLGQRIEHEEKRVIQSIRNQYESALDNEQRLLEQAKNQKEEALVMNDKATQYKILEREVTSNKEIYNSLLNRSKEIQASVGSDIGSIEIIDPARVAAFPYKPNTRKNLLMGILLGCFAGVGLAFLLEYMDNTIKDPEEFPRRYQMPILGMIPWASERKRGSGKSAKVKGTSAKSEDEREMARKFFHDPRAPLSEAIRTAMVSIELSSVGHPPKTILITSVLPNAGKSTIASNFSLSLLPESGKILLIDTDLRKPTLHRMLGDGDNDLGLSNLLTGTAKPAEIIRESEFDKLHYVSSGPIPPNPAELLASKRMREFISEVAQEYDYVVIDAPPFHGFAEILILSNMVDGVILVAEMNVTPREGISYFRKAVTNVGGQILGVLVNKVESGSNYGYYKGYKYYNSYKYYQNDYSYGRDKD